MKRDKQVLLDEVIGIAGRIRHAEQRIRDMHNLLETSPDAATTSGAKFLMRVSTEFLERQQAQWKRWWKRYGEFLVPHNQETIETLAMKDDAWLFVYKTIKYREELSGMNADTPAVERLVVEHCLERGERDWARIQTILSKEEIDELLAEAEEAVRCERIAGGGE